MTVPRARSNMLVSAHASGAGVARARRGFLHPKTRTEAALVAAFACSLAGLVIAGLFYSSVTFNWFFTSDDTPTLALATKPVGRVVVPMDGTTCREFTFDNDDGRIAGYRMMPCADPPKPEPTPPLVAGFASFKQAFGKR